MGDTDISNGKVDGDTVSFDVVREFNGNSMTLHYTGKVAGDEIHFTVAREGGEGRTWSLRLLARNRKVRAKAPRSGS